MKILDLFGGGGGSQGQGDASFELPSDGATSGQTRSVLEGLSNAVGDISNVWNAFSDDTQDGKAGQQVVRTGVAQSSDSGMHLPVILGAVAVIAALLWFFLRKR